MRRVLLTGMSGTGKSTVVAELAARGYRAVDADESGLCEPVTVPAETLTGVPGQDWLWREDLVRQLLDEQTELLFLAGCAPNQGRFRHRFGHIVLLTAPVPVIVQRLASRTTNPYGKRPEEVERVLRLREAVEPLLRRVATLEVQTTVPVDQVVARILAHAGQPIQGPL
ncbi:MAG: AAA family ATPase [Micromonosporaceae bacterium]|nr:AAA family ATPase [Micromonosporaceae bacterium]